MTTFCNRLIYNTIRFLTSFGMTVSNLMVGGREAGAFCRNFSSLNKFYSKRPGFPPLITPKMLSFRAKREICHGLYKVWPWRPEYDFFIKGCHNVWSAKIFE